MKILFVCTGNTCRSPMAQVMAQSLGYSASSAGVCAFGGSPASANAVLAMQEKGLDLSPHKSRQIDISVLEGIDIVLTMTDSHKETVLQNFAGKVVYTLGEYAGEDFPVCDPFGGDLETYRSCAEEIFRLLEKIQEKL